jgi:hypothetical protein
MKPLTYLLLLTVACGCGSESRKYKDSELGGGGQGGEAGKAQTTQAGTGGSSTAAGGSTLAGGTANGGNGGTDTGGVTASGGTSSTGTTLVPVVITKPDVTSGKTNVPYSVTISANGATSYSWSIASGALPEGLTLQNTTSSAVTISGTPRSAGIHAVKLAVTDGSRATTVDVEIAITHRVAFLSDRISSGIPELFLSEVGGATVGDPIRVNTPISTGGVSKFAWSPRGEKLAYLLSTGELRAVSAAAPGVSSLVATGISSFQWAPGTLTLVVTKPSSIGIVDLSGATAEVLWVALPEVTTTRSISNFSLGGSGKDLCVATKPDTTALGALVYHVSWVTPTTVAVKEIRKSTYGGSCGPFSFDSTMVTSTGNDGGFKLHDLTNGTLYTAAFPGSSFWDPNSNTIVSYYNTMPPLGLNLNKRTGSAIVASTIVNDPDANTAPGPWSPDGHHILYSVGNANLMTIANVETAAPDSGTSLLPADFTTNTFTSVAEYGWSPDSAWVALRADRYDESINDLFLVRWSEAGVATRPYTSRLTPGVSTYQFAPSAENIAYVGILGAATVPQLFVTQLPATGLPSAGVQLSTVSGPSVQNDIGWLPGSRVLLYRANDPGGNQLHHVHLAANGAASSPMSTSGASGNGVTSYQIAPIR